MKFIEVSQGQNKIVLNTDYITSIVSLEGNHYTTAKSQIRLSRFYGGDNLLDVDEDVEKLSFKIRSLI